MTYSVLLNANLPGTACKCPNYGVFRGIQSKVLIYVPKQHTRTSVFEDPTFAGVLEYALWCVHNGQAVIA